MLVIRKDVLIGVSVRLTVLEMFLVVPIVFLLKFLTVVLFEQAAQLRLENGFYPVGENGNSFWTAESVLSTRPLI